MMFFWKKKVTFERTVKLVHDRLFQNGERLGTSILEALLVGVSKNIDYLEELENDIIQAKFAELKEHPSLATEYLSGGVSKKEKVVARINASTLIFSADGQ